MKKMKTKAGNVSRRPPAYRKGNGDTASCWTSCAGKVVLRRVSTAAAKTSFQEVTKANSAATARPGMLLGSTTRNTAPRWVHPSDMAASSSSWGTLTKTLDTSNTVKGSEMAACT